MAPRCSPSSEESTSASICALVLSRPTDTHILIDEVSNESKGHTYKISVVSLLPRESVPFPGTKRYPVYENPKVSKMNRCANKHHVICSQASSQMDDQGIKQRRTCFSEAQLAKLRELFEVSWYYAESEYTWIAGQLKLTPNVVKVWFKNQRSKRKKIGLRQSVTSIRPLLRNVT